jgi:hypothetical protein
MSRQIVEQVQCDHCKEIVTRPLQPSGVKGGRPDARPIPDGWVAVIRRYTEVVDGYEVTKKVDNIYCGTACAIAALQTLPERAAVSRVGH